MDFNKLINCRITNMKTTSLRFFFIGIIFFQLVSCSEKIIPAQSVRPMADSIGFAVHSRQMDSIMQRIKLNQADLLTAAVQSVPKQTVKAAISPHDDYTYAGWLYPAVLSQIKAGTVIIFGVAHKARKFNLENKIIFDSFSAWHGPYKNAEVSSMREDIMADLDTSVYLVHDEMQQVEHSVEALVPFLQYFNREVQIVSILVPYMPHQRMQAIAAELSRAINNAAQKRSWKWGRDYALLISNDAIHYGDQDWGGKNLAPMGTGEEGYKRVAVFERQIIDECLSGPLNKEMIEKFTEYTVKEDNYKEYKWTWCGRYSLPFGLLTSFYHQESHDQPLLTGHLLGYALSVDHDHIKVDDLGMGTTAPANLNHWVGYVGMVYY